LIVSQSLFSFLPDLFKPGNCLRFESLPGKDALQKQANFFLKAVK